MAPERKGGVQKRITDKSGLGRALINRRAKTAKILADPTLHSAEIQAGLRSVTQENDLDEFLSTALLADTDFAAERQNIKVVADPSLKAQSHNPYLLTPTQEREMREKQKSNVARLQVPRRPAWNRQMTTVELERKERDSFLAWRRGLADLQDNQALLLTPFERNLEVWRQLWRTCERSDLVVQIVDARNPLNFRSEDLGRYVLELNDTNGGNSDAPAPAHTEANTDDGDKGEGSSSSASAPTAKPRRQNLLLINKSDLLTQKQREAWADYFEKHQIEYAFFSAANGIALQEERARQEEMARLEALEAAADEESDSDEDEEGFDTSDLRASGFDSGVVPGMKIPKSGNKLNAKGPSQGKAKEQEQSSGEEEDSADDDSSSDDDDEDGTGLAKKMRRGVHISEPGSDESPRTRILSVLELEDLFLSRAPEVSLARGHSNERMVVGLVGYPNVGKSSTINALIGEKKVSVSATPGKTKHFQTIRLSEDVLLCDCPGLVFPQFAATKADLVCDGVLPIDQLREFTGPVTLVTKRIPQEVLEGVYGLRITTLPVSEGGSGVPTAEEFLTTYAIARGFFTGGQGNADVSKASRLVLKDYVNGKLLYCVPPPDISADEFNAENRDPERLRAQGLFRTKRAPTTRVPLKADTYINTTGEDGASHVLSKTRQSARAKALDRNFFASGHAIGMPSVRGVAGEKTGASFSRVKIFPHQQNAVNDKGEVIPQKRLTNRQKKKAAAEAVGMDADKKHFKVRREKQRSGRGYDD